MFCPPFRLGAVLLLCGSALRAQAPASPAASQHLQRAHALLAQNKPKEAIVEFKSVLASDPSNADAVGNLGVLLYFAGDFAASQPLLERTVAQQPVPKLEALLGFCERRNGNPEKARRDLAAALPGLGDAPIRRQAGLELIELDTAAGDLAAAAAVASQLKAATPEDPAILYAAYRVYTDLAGEAMLDLSVAAPKSAQMHQAMAHELIRERDNKAAIANFRAALLADPNLPGIHYELAEALFQSAEPALKAEAEQQYRLALQANPNDDKTITKLGDFAGDRAEHEKAMALYRQALQLAPGNTDAGVGLAHELVETEQLEPALKILQALEQVDPTDVLVHFRLSALYRRMGRPEDAKREIAEQQKYKAIKDKLRALYQEMRISAPTAAQE